MKEIGVFLNESREYEIRNMYPKRPWLNYLWNEQTIATIDQFGSGTSRFKDENDIRKDITGWQNSRLLFIRDEATKEFWAANRNFDRKEFTKFYTKVGQGYSTIVSEYKDIECSYKLFLATEGPTELWQVDVTNNGDTKRSITLTAYADAQVNVTGHAAYNCGKYVEELNGVFLSHHGFNMATPYGHAIFASTVTPVAFETSNRRFTGVYGNCQNPDALHEDRLSCKTTSFDNIMVTALQFEIELEAGESKNLLFLLSLAKSLEEAKDICNKKLNEKYFEDQLIALQEDNEAFINKVYIETPHEEINSMANIWLKRSMSLGKTWGRGYAKGFRDIMQDVTGFMPLDTKVALEKIKHCLEYQFEDGNTLRQWQPDDFHPYRDGASWLIYSVAGYIKETGDFSILDEVISYYGGKDEGTILDHCERGINFLLDGVGEHGLCLWGGGDWNDSINNVGMQMKGESLWLSEATVKSALEFALLYDRMGDKQKATKLRAKAELLKQNILKHGWDKDHFIYGYNDWMEKIGAYESPEGKIYLNPQAWAVLADIVEGDEAYKLLDFVERELSCDFGYVQVKPSYSHGDDHIGRISYMEKGCYENGSVYNHGVTFKIAADCKLGRGNLAYQSILMMLSSNPKNPSTHSGLEPYAVTNMYLGPENESRKGESLMSWITGTGGWLFRCITEFMIGVQADYDGLKVVPCLPSHWKEVKMIRSFRDATYNITIQNPKGLEVGKVSIKVDGAMIDGNVIPDLHDMKKHIVVVEICE